MAEIGTDWFGQVIVARSFFDRDRGRVARAFEGFCPFCPGERLYVTDEPTDSPAYAAAVEASIGEEWDTSLMHCHCCGGLFALNRGEPFIEDATFPYNWIDGYIDPPCEHVVVLKETP